MDLNQISSGQNIPELINVVIEIPERSEPVKYEIDKKSGALFVDRFLDTAMFYPCNYGFVPQTLSEDGDPVDVLVISPAPLLSGSVISCRPVAMLEMEDEKGVDAKILAVPSPDVCKYYNHIQGPDDVSPHLLRTIEHFFRHYKDLEQNKWVKIKGWVGAQEAKLEIKMSSERYQKSN